MAKNIFLRFHVPMIYSKRLNTYIPVTIKSFVFDSPAKGKYTKYTLSDGEKLIGDVDLKDTPKGVQLLNIRNLDQRSYSGVGKLANQLGVEHCMRKGFDTFEIVSEPSENSLALSYLRGERFFSEKMNEILSRIIASTMNGERINTMHLGKLKMYMPQSLIDKYKALSKKQPLLK